jgi:hypothetical protein
VTTVRRWLWWQLYNAWFNAAAARHHRTAAVLGWVVDRLAAGQGWEQR